MRHAPCCPALDGRDRPEYRAASDRLGIAQKAAHPRWLPARLGIGGAGVGLFGVAGLRRRHGVFPRGDGGDAHWHGAERSRWHRRKKRSGVRGPENVWGSALTATICALGAWIAASGRIAGLSPPWVALFALGYVASFATKLADTTASEVGKAYGKRTFLITTLRPVPAGTEGAVSLEGTLAGVVGSAVIAAVGWATGLISLVGVGLCLVAAFIATNLESVIGATLQEQVPWLTNELVNIVNTTIGAIAAMLLALVFAQALP